MMKVLLLLFFCSITSVFSDCPLTCDCPEVTSKCPGSQNLVRDGCDCCLVCPRELNDQCDDEMRVCADNLYCDFSRVSTFNTGVCSNRKSRDCVRNDGQRVPSGEVFQPSCDQKCWCLDGYIGCMSLCKTEYQPPEALVCPGAHLVNVEGKCCRQWACEREDEWLNKVFESRKDGGLNFENDINELEIGVLGDGGDDGDELVDYHNSHKKTLIDNDVLQPNHRVNHSDGSIQMSQSLCRPLSSTWTPCSKSCGIGVSTRVSNTEDSSCKLHREMRLCYIRPCQGSTRYQPNRGRKCARQKKGARREHITYAGCRSTRSMRFRFCGLCESSNRCCTPKKSRTTKVRFRCHANKVIEKSMLIIRSCHCHHDCKAHMINNNLPMI